MIFLDIQSTKLGYWVEIIYKHSMGISKNRLFDLENIVSRNKQMKWRCARQVNELTRKRMEKHKIFEKQKYHGCERVTSFINLQTNWAGQYKVLQEELLINDHYTQQYTLTLYNTASMIRIDRSCCQRW